MRVHKGRYVLQHPQKKLSIVEKGLTIEGLVSVKGQLFINGTVKGTLVGDHIVITEEGVVEAETRASFITIGGIFRGRLTVSGKLVLLSTGVCSGIIECQDMELEPGGVLNGEINCGPVAESALCERK
ncbi:MAG: polymer-forming cytoskeletal protein [Deltaproteobacteria bacterium]|nr:MAG: polymer-forming cytoskeletal protein [Deltaproteobacteria bacterium]RLC18446.1 MAG: polymer-forming cytoskeletal protein [Deltaproteobacteria bacterium]HHE73734.1 polymer-forming cytoskeletal protein [Desulfobacteraceae bacterium]